jgi:hypothetical protein
MTKANISFKMLLCTKLTKYLSYTLDLETNGIETILLAPVIPKFPFVKGCATYNEGQKQYHVQLLIIQILDKHMYFVKYLKYTISHFLFVPYIFHFTHFFIGKRQNN